MNIQIIRAIQCLKKEGVIIYPSESCYSFGCDAKNKKAVEKIHELKKESKDKPITLNISSLRQIRKFGFLNNAALKLYKRFMPGHLNLIIKKRNNKKFLYLSKRGISFRISKNPTALELSKKFGSAITTTSVNMHNSPPLYKISEVKRYFHDKVDYIIDAGNLNSKIPPSTIYDTINKRIVRNGPVSESEIKKVLS
jgi:L-threonylcarbamoyladenylate synthase